MTESKISYKIVLDKTNLIWVWRNHTRAFNFNIRLKVPYFYEYIVYTLEKLLQEKFSLLSKRLNKFNWISYNFQRRNYLRKYGIRLQCKLKNVIKNRMFIYSNAGQKSAEGRFLSKLVYKFWPAKILYAYQDISNIT